MDESSQVVKLLQRMGSLLGRIGMSNFTINDLSPDSRRLVQILSTLIIFGMYRNDRKHAYKKASKMADDNFAIKKKLESQPSSTKDSIEKGASGA